MNKVLVWISAMRLRTLPLSLSGIVLASCFAEYNGCFKWNIFILAILTTLSFQILSNLANDYGDGVKGTDNEDRIGPNRTVQSGSISSEAMLGGIKTSILISIILALMLIFVAFGVRHFWLTITFFLLGIAAVVSAIRYTIGSNPYGYRAKGDIFVFVFFGLVSVIGGYVLYAKHMDHVVILPALIIGILSAAVLNLNNMRDIESDKKSNKITLAVKLGLKNIKLYHLFLIASATILSILFGILYFVRIYNFLFVIAFVPLVLHFLKVYRIKDPKQFDPELKKLALTTFLLAVLMGIGYLL